MQRNTLCKILMTLLTVYVVFTVGVRWIAGDRFHIRNVQTDEMPSPGADVGEITKGVTLKQPFSIDANRITNITLFLATYERNNDCSLLIRVEDASGVLGECRVAAADIEYGKEFVCWLPEPWQVPAKEPMWLTVTSDDAVPGNAVSAYWGSSVALQKGALQKKVYLSGWSSPFKQQGGTMVASVSEATEISHD